MSPAELTLKARPNGHGPTVSYLVMVDVTWAYCRFPLGEGPEKQVWNQYSSLLTGLLALHEDDHDSPGAWVLHDQQQEGKAPKWCSGIEAQRMVGLIARGLEQCELASTPAWMNHQEKLLAAQMNLFACRIYLTPKQARAKLAPQADTSTPSAHVCIDFRFQARPEEYLNCYWLHATLSVWTHKPSSLTHAPELFTDKTEERPRTLHQVTAYAEMLRKGFKEHVGEHFYPTKVEILKREHRPPQFWFARGSWLTAAPSIIGQITRFNPLADKLLQVPDVRSTGVAAGVIQEREFVLRHFYSNDEEIPYYLVIPFRGDEVERENDARKLVRGLTDLEAFAAARLFDVVTLLDMYASHVNVYEGVADQADAFWNQLALYLPVTRGSRVHKLIELVHQTLLQSIADLDQAGIRTNEAVRRTEWSASRLKDQFDRTFTERPLPGKDSIRSSLTETGYFDKANRQANRAHKDAEQIRRSYKSLLDGIALAFDARRVRGTDVVQRVSFVFAFFLAIFTFFLPEAVNAVFTIGHGWPYPRLFFLSMVGAIGFVLAGLVLFLRKCQLSTLGRSRFRRRHRQIKGFLADCATDRLTRLREAGWKRVQEARDRNPTTEKHAWDTFFAQWDDLDRALARQCAELLDALARDGDSPPAWSFRAPLFEDLAGQVERWALKAVLVTERPREFWQFPLPRLTFLYRFYPIMGNELRSNSIAVTEVKVVSDADFNLSLLNQCSGNHEQIADIECWAQNQIERSRFLPNSATEFVNALNDVGLKAGMSRKDFETMLERMRKQLARA